MSRCFPYPPPGYTLSGARNEALIESIKLQKEKERKLERKEKKERRKEKKVKRKERKERKKEKKEKTNRNLCESDVQKLLISADKSSIQKQHDISPKSFSDRKIESLQKKREAENNQSEQSSLTEEHALPSSLFIPSSSSESTENSKKRKRQSPPEDDTNSQGKVILIRLPSRKQNELDELVQGQQPCSTSGRSETGDANHVKDLPENFPTRSNCRGPNAENNGEHICSTSGQIEAEKIRTNIAKSEAVLSSIQKMDLEYQNLFGDFFPPQVQESWLCSEDLDWLLKGNSQHNQEIRAEKKPRYGNEVLSSCSRSLGLWPRAEYLREVDVYALPFTVPY